MEGTFGPTLLPVPILDSAEISLAALRMMTVYKLEKPIGTARTHSRRGGIRANASRRPQAAAHQSPRAHAGTPHGTRR